MMVTLNINRIKHGDELLEIFTVFPRNSIMFDRHRAIYLALWYCRNKYSVANILPLKKTTINKDNTVYTYDFQNIDVPQNQQIKIQYSPVLGEKTCRVCAYECVIHNKSVCLMRGVPNKKNSHYKCAYWTESPETLRISHALHNPRRPKENRANAK